jgi:hypothetical protein
LYIQYSGVYFVSAGEGIIPFSSSSSAIEWVQTPWF